MQVIVTNRSWQAHVERSHIHIWPTDSMRVDVTNHT